MEREVFKRKVFDCAIKEVGKMKVLGKSKIRRENGRK